MPEPCRATQGGCGQEDAELGAAPTVGTSWDGGRVAAAALHGDLEKRRLLQHEEQLLRLRRVLGPQRAMTP